MIRMNAFTIVPLLLGAAVHAGEITVETRPFSIETSFNAAVMPDKQGVLLQLDPKAWAEFQIEKLADHGSKVAKGDVLVRFDAEAIDKKLVDSRRWIASNTLNVAQAEMELKILEETAPHVLDAAKRAADIAVEENNYFTTTRRKASEELAAHELERKKQILSNQQEELKQLSKMYAADDLTEDTEEIILVRQKDAVAAAELALRIQQLEYKRTMEVTLPRQAVALADAERDALIALRRIQEETPRSIALKKMELEGLKTNHERQTKALAELEADRELFEMKAPAEGWFYHGPIDNGRWTPAEAVKSLYLHGKPPANRPFATFVPAAAKLSLVAFLDEATGRGVAADTTGIATLAGRDDIELPVKVERIAPTPGTDNTYRADLSVTWPKELTPATGSIAQVRMISYAKPAAIVVPARTLAFTAEGWTVEVKLADGKSERRPVKRGRTSKDDVEILSGLDVGQVLITADPKSAPAK